MSRPYYIPLGVYQLLYRRTRLLAGLSGIALAVLLLLAQQGVRGALLQSQLLWHHALDYDLVLLSAKSERLARLRGLPRENAALAAAVEGVAGVAAVHTGRTNWQNPVLAEQLTPILVIAFTPGQKGFGNIIDGAQQALLRLPDRVLFDAASHPDYGPIPDLLSRGNALSVPLNGRNIHISGTFEVGRAFGIGGALLTSEQNFRQLFPRRSTGTLSLALVHLEQPDSARQMQQALREALPKEVQVLRRRDFVRMEANYWNHKTPLGFVFSFGMLLAFLVGTVIAYQVLFAGIRDHLGEYAMLRAIGYDSSYLDRVLGQQVLLLACSGSLLGWLLWLPLRSLLSEAVELPLRLTIGSTLGSLLMALLLCTLAGVLARRQLRAALPEQACG